MRYVPVLVIGMLMTYALGGVGAGLALVSLAFCWFTKPWEPGELSAFQRETERIVKEREARVNELTRRAIEAHRSKSRS